VTVTKAGREPAPVSVKNEEKAPVPVKLMEQPAKVEVANTEPIPVEVRNKLEVETLPDVNIGTMPQVDIRTMPPVEVEVPREPLPPWVRVGNSFPLTQGTITEIVGNWVQVERSGEQGFNMWVYLPTGQCYVLNWRYAVPACP
jgi:hypothetical protein